ncbi:HAMP domain-containing protein [bacterium LRH843]|nr:HAMP domain-containing protein [bacterium LRH843]
MLFKKSIKVRLLTYFLLVSILPILLVGFIPYYKSQEIVERQVLELSQSIVNQLNENINYYLREMDLMSKVIYYQITTNKEQDVIDIDEVREFLLDLKKNRAFIKDIHVLTDTDSATTAKEVSREELHRNEWFIDSLTRRDEKTWVGPHASNYSSNHAEVISLVYPFSYKGEDIVILIDLKQEEFNMLFARFDLTNLGTLLLIDKFGEVIYSTEPSLIKESEEQYISHLNFYNQLNHDSRLIYAINFFSGWKIAVLIPENHIRESFQSIKQIVFVLLGVFLLISIVLAWILSNRFIYPLRRLQHDIRGVEKGNFHIRSGIDTIDEVGDLSKSFNKMVEEIESLIKKISINEKKKKQIEMQSLQYQINPHFLYNTLNSIQWLARLHKVPDISEMLTSLIKLLRTSLDSANHLHMLEEELEVLNYYLKIQTYRYPDSFTVQYEIDRELLSAYVPRFILQPLVENIFFHGFIDGAGDIVIEASKKDHYLQIAVKDNGRGMPGEVAETLLHKKGKKKGKTSSGIGIHNVDDKIKLYFGAGYGLHISSKEGFGTTIYINLPVTYEKEEGEVIVKRFISG